MKKKKCMREREGERNSVKFMTRLGDKEIRKGEGGRDVEEMKGKWSRYIKWEIKKCKRKERREECKRINKLERAKGEKERERKDTKTNNPNTKQTSW